MATSKELRDEVRRFLDAEYVEGLRASYGTHGAAIRLRDTLVALLLVLDAEEKERQAQDVEWVILRSKGGVEFKVPAMPPGYRWEYLGSVPMPEPPDDEGEGHGP